MGARLLAFGQYACARRAVCRRHTACQARVTTRAYMGGAAIGRWPIRLRWRAYACGIRRIRPPAARYCDAIRRRQRYIVFP